MTPSAPAPDFDSIVIGAGSAGLAFAQEAAQNGARIALVERGAIGGTCVNRGCVPKKLMWEAASLMARTTETARLGLSDAARFDLRTLREAIQRRLSDIHDDYATKLAEKGVTLLRGTAHLPEPGCVEIDGKPHRARQIVIATGARPQQPDLDGIGLAATSDQVFHWTAVPERLAILGGGYIGAEFASIFAALGAKVTLIEPGDRILSEFDAELVATVSEMLEARGITLRLGTAPTCLAQSPEGLQVVLGDGPPVTADRVLSAVGRQPNVDTLGPLVAGLDRAKSGALAVDARFETSQPGLFAIGDVADRLPLTPVAVRDGETLAHMLHGRGGTQVDLSLVATACYTIPPMAQVGHLSPEGGRTEETTLHPLETWVLAREGSGLDRSRSRLAYDAEGRLTGAGLLSKAAPDLIAGFAALLAAGATRETLSQATGTHPSFAEDVIGRS
ncbi:dihydrolipoyl dehydrogenase family protein [Celeribacter indicus]|uniref:Glutathione reductase Gor n=1 Tax=Celeribacter indicus TaxID=1208324 RepID=A0A0B5DPQ4_9RHOB|nr:NAD(P)/FAD-dependent oxidoreductase [Celeribacter indicus]AJE45548.1 glutathione reductase Gor [Celeribacter indicus]SDW86286.1 glutathione reductase (NADPH) [Celeribacter indicus]